MSRRLAFDYLNCISGVDYLHTDEKKAAKSRVAAAHGSRLSPVQHEAQAQPGAEGDAAAVEGRQAGRVAGGAERLRPVEHGRLARARGVRPVAASTSPAIRTCGGSSARKIGSAIRCAKITKCRSSTTAFEEGRRVATMSTAVEDPRIIEFDVRTDEMLVNMGPQHPSTHGVLRLVLRTDGEIVSEVMPHIGYLHRCAEKIGENLTPRQWIPYTDRMDYLAGMNMNLGWSLCGREADGLPRAGARPASAGAHLRAGPHRQPPGRHGRLRPRPRHVQPVPVRLPRARKDSRPVRRSLRRPAHLQLPHAGRRDGRPAARLAAEVRGSFSISSCRSSRSITRCSRPTRSS